MGTRNLTCVVHNGQYKVAQYGQWDGYPEGQGMTALTFLRDRMDKEKFLSRIAQTRFVTDEEIKQAYKDAGADGSGFVSMDVVSKFQKRFPYINRDHGAEVLEMIQDQTDAPELRNDIDFAGDSLSCEWAYVIDFDKNTFEVYRGFNKAPVDTSERFANVAKTHSDYDVVRHVVTFSLRELPTNEEFLAHFKEEDEDAA